MAYWSIGERIAAQKITRGAGYYSSVIKDLASDVGLASRTIYDAVQFFEAYNTPPQDNTLSWTHHRLLLRLSTKKARAFYIAEFKKHGWSSRELEAAIAAGLHEGGTPPSLVLKRPTRPDFVYGAKVLEVIDGDTLQLEIDLGFDVFRKIRVRLANAPTSTTFSSKKSTPTSFNSLDNEWGPPPALSSLRCGKAVSPLTRTPPGCASSVPVEGRNPRFRGQNPAHAP